MTAQRLDVRFRIVWESHWHAGSGEGDAMFDRRVRRRAESRLPLLPGSQFKGVLRHHCERLAALLGNEVVSPHHVGRQPPAELLQQFGPLARSGLVIDRLFGSRYQGDCLFVDDALPEEVATHWPAWGHARTAIDRLTRTARDRTLFVSEVVSGQGRALVGQLKARHPAGVLTPDDRGFPHEYALLLAGLLAIESLGGDRSVGLGRCRIEIPTKAVRWNGTDFRLSEALRSLAEPDWKVQLELDREGMNQS
ncbi:MAG: RAMP superfamily CRISPR-associated protein [Gemmataceae bacterium]|nr:RAMP superfamily CRISPR-associated protein [Gemmataceae bacterium]